MSNEYPRDRERQRRISPTTLGFKEIGILPSTPYTAPSTYPDDACAYLKALSRCGTLSGAATLAGITPARVYKFRANIEGFTEEEQIARDVLTDMLENSLFEAGLGFAQDVQGSARVKALETALKANRSNKYNTQRHEVKGDVQLSWLEILRSVEESD